MSAASPTCTIKYGNFFRKATGSNFMVPLESMLTFYDEVFQQGRYKVFVPGTQEA